jgi:hypothetical protein
MKCSVGLEKFCCVVGCCLDVGVCLCLSWFCFLFCVVVGGVGCGWFGLCFGFCFGFGLFFGCCWVVGLGFFCCLLCWFGWFGLWVYVGFVSGAGGEVA